MPNSKFASLGLSVLSTLSIALIAPPEAQALGFWNGCTRQVYNFQTQRYENRCTPSVPVQPAASTLRQCQNELNVLRRTTDPTARRFFEQAFIQNCRRFSQYLR